MSNENSTETPTPKFLPLVDRRVFFSGIAGIIAAASSKPIKAGSQSKADALALMPQFIRELVAQKIGVSVETIHEWIDSREKGTQKLMCDAVEIIGEEAKMIEKARLASKGAS